MRQLQSASFETTRGQTLQDPEQLQSISTDSKLQQLQDECLIPRPLSDEQVVIFQSLPPFLKSLYKILVNGEFAFWDKQGASFYIIKPNEFAMKILPQYYKHCNLNSFVRQLNCYGFRKNKLDECHSQLLSYQHDSFKINQINEMLTIKRSQGTNFKQYEDLLNNQKNIVTTRGTEAQTLNGYKAPYKKTRKNAKVDFLLHQETTPGGPLSQHIESIQPGLTKQYPCSVNHEICENEEEINKQITNFQSQMIQKTRGYIQTPILPRKMKKKNMVMEFQQQQFIQQCISNKRNKKRYSNRKADVLMKQLAQKIQDLENEKKLILLQLSQTQYQCLSWKQRAILCQAKLNSFVKSIALRMKYNTQNIRAQFFEQEQEFEADNPCKYAEREVLKDSQGNECQLVESEDSKNKILQLCKFYGLKGRRLVDIGDQMLNEQELHESIENVDSKPRKFKINVILFDYSQDEDQQRSAKVEQIVNQKKEALNSDKFDNYPNQVEEDQEKQCEIQNQNYRFNNRFNIEQSLSVNEQQSSSQLNQNINYPLLFRSDSLISSNREIFWNGEHQQQQSVRSYDLQHDNKQHYNLNFAMMRDQSYLNSNQNSEAPQYRNEQYQYYNPAASCQILSSSHSLSQRPLFQLNDLLNGHSQNYIYMNQQPNISHFNREHSEIESIYHPYLNQGNDIQQSEQLASNCGRQRESVSVSSDIMTHHSKLEDSEQQQQGSQYRGRGINLDDDDDDDYGNRSDSSSFISKYQQN